MLNYNPFYYGNANSMPSHSAKFIQNQVYNSKTFKTNILKMYIPTTL